MKLNAFETAAPGVSWAAATWTAPTVPTLAFWTGRLLGDLTGGALIWTTIGAALLLPSSPLCRGVGAGLVGAGLISAAAAQLFPWWSP